MIYLLMGIVIVLAVGYSCLLRGYREINKKDYDVFLFNGGISFVWVPIMIIFYFVSDNRVNIISIKYGIIYGVILFAFMFFKTQSLANGPVSLSTLISSCAFLMTTAFGVVYAHEEMSIFQILGTLLLIISLIMCVNPKRSNEKLTVKWMMYCLGFFLSGGFAGILYKLFGSSSASEDAEVMLLTAAVVSMILFLIVGIRKEKKIEKMKPDKTILIFMLFSGIVSCVYTRMNLALSGRVSSVVYFPVINGGVLVLSTMIGHLCFKESLKKIQWCGIALACVGIVTIGCGNNLFELFF